ncbi:MAG: signal peptidase II [Pseudomonadota bacterium]|nr:signal peptidase II [Pseudomonadota bacterium]MEC8287765.1 signal peptidase II [Pseudomonadota bacterium]MEC8315311.1 signal peptidase II [Pseudomonadota bacterium]MEC8426534.1 signal peptidase II [Pseudomonadota bacterium]MEC8497017.1 signal peptidase II [Pseudomonadota bacterium]|tara:strand:- start:6755 stop:7258 length:504 start_codon:yes stop_codon:yes gene_type:complete
MNKNIFRLLGEYKKEIAIFSGLFTIDRLVKVFLLNFLQENQLNSFRLNNFFEVTLVWNKGVSYGLFPQQSYVGQLIIIFFSLIICVWIAKFITNSDIRYRSITLILILAGASSNMIDRLIYGAVADFFHFEIATYSWYVFNIADIYIVSGLLILIYAFIYPNIKKSP